MNELLNNLFLNDILLFKIFNMDFINKTDFLELLVRFGINFTVSFIIIRFIYYKSTNKKDYLFSYLLISVIIFFLCYMLGNVKIELGFALGLFAIFGIIRYRTKQIPIKEMTYLFVIIGVSVVNALSNNKISFVEIAFVNIVIILIIGILERVWLIKFGVSKKIVYEKIENIKPENYHILKKDLEERTGLQIKKIEIKNVNFLK